MGWEKAVRNLTAKQVGCIIKLALKPRGPHTVTRWHRQATAPDPTPGAEYQLMNDWPGGGALLVSRTTAARRVTVPSVSPVAAAGGTRTRAVICSLRSACARALTSPCAGQGQAMCGCATHTALAPHPTPTRSIALLSIRK